MRKQKVWKIKTRDPLIFGNGKPFSPAPGSKSETLPLPYPSTVAGAVKTSAFTDHKTGQFRKKTGNDEPILIRGPFLAEEKTNSDLIYYLPAPADILILKQDMNMAFRYYPLRPISPSNEFRFSPFKDHPYLTICGTEEVVKGKPYRKSPAFWDWKYFEKWLLDPGLFANLKPNEIGISKLMEDSRVHVRIDPETQAAVDGALFETNGLVFDFPGHIDEAKTPALMQNKHYILSLSTDAPLENGIRIGYLGGERRMIGWEFHAEEFPFSKCPGQIKQKIVQDGFCRIVFVTPAFLTTGSFFSKSLQKKLGIQVLASINQRHQTTSGWDYKNNTPKESIRLIPAGSVYFIKLPDDIVEREALVDELWFQPIGSDKHLNNSGFGIALLGTWNGEFYNLPTETKNED